MMPNQGAIFTSLLIISSFFFSCKKDPQAKRIGEEYEGGVIFYVDQSGQHGWIAAREDLPMAHWGIYISYNSQGEYYPATNATSTIDGFSNTQKIVGVYGDTVYAAKLCHDYGGGGFHDWYLPAKDQLDSLYHRSISDIISLKLRHDYGYWSSTEATAFDAWFQDFGNGHQFNYLGGSVWWPNKVVNFFIRPIRSF